MREFYRHTQIGFGMLLFWLIGGSVFIFYSAQVSLSLGRGSLFAVFGISFFLLCIITVLFNLLSAILTIRVTDEYLEARFAFPLLWTRVNIEEILSAKHTEPIWINGYGYRIALNGSATCHVSGSKGIRLELTNKKQFTIGTDDLENLERAIRQALEARGQKLEQPHLENTV
jgi:hypothetical protein